MDEAHMYGSRARRCQFEGPALSGFGMHTTAILWYPHKLSKYVCSIRAHVDRSTERKWGVEEEETVCACNTDIERQTQQQE